MEPIEIVKCSEVIDNWGNIKWSDEHQTFKLLISSEYWSDDQLFYDNNNRVYNIDELIGKRVTCGSITFTVMGD